MRMMLLDYYSLNPDMGPQVRGKFFAGISGQTVSKCNIIGLVGLTCVK